MFHEPKKIRAAGYALDDSENNPDVRCVAAPIFNMQGKVEAALGLTGTESQMKLERLKDYVRLIKQAARHISQRLGYKETFYHPATTQKISDWVTAR